LYKPHLQAFYIKIINRLYEKLVIIDRRNFEGDEKAVSPVIGVIMLIAIVVIIAAVVAALAFGIVEGVKRAPGVALVVEGVRAGTNVKVTIFHHGGDTISGAFKTATDAEPANKWDNLEVRLNGAIVSSSSANGLWKNGIGCNETTWTASFTPGDQLTITFKMLDGSDTLSILHQPSETLLLRKEIT
jgi:flagellin-like protein